MMPLLTPPGTTLRGTPLPLPVAHAVTRKTVPPPLKCGSLFREKMFTTDELVDSALARSQHLLSELTNFGLDDKLDDQGDSTPTSTGTSNNTWGSFSSNESEDESSRAESEPRSVAHLQTLEEELCGRLRDLEEELRVVRKVSECSVACSCNLPESQVTTCLVGKPLSSKELLTTTSPIPLLSRNLVASLMSRPRSAPVFGIPTRSRKGPLCKFVAVTRAIACESFEA